MKMCTPLGVLLLVCLLTGNFASPYHDYHSNLDELFQSYLDASGVTKSVDTMTSEELNAYASGFMKSEIPKVKQAMSVRGSVVSSHSPLEKYNVPELINYYGYPVETYYVTTEDGYVLQIHRIPHGVEGVSSNEPREPVIIQHGILCSSADWTMNPPEIGIAYMMADAGYDVWLPNLRGNSYSRNHTSLNPDRKEFWDYSWDEMGHYDMPAIIDFILERTGFSELYYVGHSMGTTLFFVMMDSFPEYNEKVNSFYAMAPITAVDNMKSPVHFLRPFVTELTWFAKLIHLYEFAPSNRLMDFLAATLCEDDDFTQFICKDIIFMLCGFNEKQLNETMIPIYVAHTPAGTSMKTLTHYGQSMQSAIFRHYDYGRRENKKKYGSETPPNYDLGKTTTDTYLYYGENDWMADPVDVAETAEALPNVKLFHRVEDDQWNHDDFMWAMQANTQVYSKIIDEIKKRTLNRN